MTKYPVVIVGGGPVGLTLALELAWHGIASLVIESRKEIDPNRPRAKTVNVRSMEHYRRLGLADTIRRRAPIRAEWNQRAVVCTALDGVELASFDGIFGIRSERDDLFAECGQQITQPLLEEILREAVENNPLTELQLGATVVELVESTDSVALSVRDSSGQRYRIDADYAVGADGAGGITRQSMGIEMERGVTLPPNVNITFRARDLDALSGFPQALHYWVVNAETQGVLIRLDPRDTWAATVSRVEDPESADPQELISRLTGVLVDAEILSTDLWSARLALADSYGTRRVYLAGDAAHLNPPWGGHGFNTGLGDAVNLGWKLGATLQGWGGDQLLASYEPERRPVAEQTIAVAAANMRAISTEVTNALRRDPNLAGPGAEVTRAEVRSAKFSEFHSLGLVLGYSYFGSPIVASDGDSPVFDPVGYRPEAIAGSRLPHGWISPEVSRYDLLHDGFTLFIRSSSTLAERFIGAARQRRVPLTVAEGLESAEGNALLVRSDGHIAWCGDDGDAGVILDMARGTSVPDAGELTMK